MYAYDNLCNILPFHPPYYPGVGEIDHQLQGYKSIKPSLDAVLCCAKCKAEAEAEAARASACIVSYGGSRDPVNTMGFVFSYVLSLVILRHVILSVRICIDYHNSSGQMIV